MKIRPNFKPLNGYVVVKQDILPQESPSGFIMRTQEELAETGVAIYVSGPYRDGSDEVTPTVRVGDRISFAKYAGMELTIGDEKLMTIREYDIIGIYEKKGN